MAVATAMAASGVRKGDGRPVSDIGSPVDDGVESTSTTTSASESKSDFDSRSVMETVAMSLLLLFLLLLRDVIMIESPMGVIGTWEAVVVESDTDARTGCGPGETTDFIADAGDTLAEVATGAVLVEVVAAVALDLFSLTVGPTTGPRPELGDSRGFCLCETNGPEPSPDPDLGTDEEDEEEDEDRNDDPCKYRRVVLHAGSGGAIGSGSCNGKVGGIDAVTCPSPHRLSSSRLTIDAWLYCVQVSSSLSTVLSLWLSVSLSVSVSISYG